jgi:hypothetical protein
MVTFKQAIWQPGSFKWHPGGPTDPNVVLVEFAAERIETWNTPGGVVPDPTKGLWGGGIDSRRRRLALRRDNAAIADLSA